jgi:hypothetical protein
MLFGFYRLFLGNKVDDPMFRIYCAEKLPWTERRDPDFTPQQMLVMRKLDAQLSTGRSFKSGLGPLPPDEDES